MRTKLEKSIGKHDIFTTNKKQITQNCVPIVGKNIKNYRSFHSFHLSENSLNSNSSHNFRSLQYVGKVIDGFFDNTNGQLVVGTEQNVLAAINTRVGSIEWRRIFEKGDRGTIQFVGQLPSESYNARNAQKIAVTVTGTTLSLVRGWNLKTGDLAWEWTFNNPNAAKPKTEHWFLTESLLFRVVMAHGSSSLDVTSYDVRTGIVDTDKNVAIQSNECQFSKTFVICLSNGKVVATNIVSGESKIVAESSSAPRVLQVNRAIFHIFCSAGFAYEIVSIV